MTPFYSFVIVLCTFDREAVAYTIFGLCFAFAQLCGIARVNVKKWHIRKSPNVCLVVSSAKMIVTYFSFNEIYVDRCVYMKMPKYFIGYFYVDRMKPVIYRSL